MHFIDDAEVSRVLTFPILIAAMEDAHRRRKIDVLDGYLGSEKQQYVVRSAIDHGRYMASKLITSFPANLSMYGPRFPGHASRICCRESAVPDCSRMKRSRTSSG